jgi:hypothetical protein
MPDSFASIRSWEGSKDRAFEEICYQLLREPEDMPPDMAGLPVRTGNPDGGVEWYARTTDETEWVGRQSISPISAASSER